MLRRKISHKRMSGFGFSPETSYTTMYYLANNLPSRKNPIRQRKLELN